MESVFHVLLVNVLPLLLASETSLSNSVSLLHFELVLMTLQQDTTISITQLSPGQPNYLPLLLCLPDFVLVCFLWPKENSEL